VGTRPTFLGRVKHVATEVDICNLALAHCANKASISSLNPPEGSEQAEACARWYPVALGCILAEHPWAFATRRKRLARLTDGEVEKGAWLYAYGLPADFNRIIDMAPSSVSSPRPFFKGMLSQHEEYELTAYDSGFALLTNELGPVLRYITSAPLPTSFSYPFVLALSWLLAAFLSGDVVRGETGINLEAFMGKQYLFYLAKAKALDATQTRFNRGHLPRWIAER